MRSGGVRLWMGMKWGFFRPWAGGGETAVNEDVFQLVHDVIQARELLENLKAPEDGAVVVFDGFVRNNFKGRRTLYLEYQAYEPMALAKIREIGEQIRT